MLLRVASPCLAVGSKDGTTDRQRLNVQVHGLFSIGLGKWKKDSRQFSVVATLRSMLCEFLLSCILSEVQGLAYVRTASS
jgi:hypothetical protein